MSLLLFIQERLTSHYKVPGCNDDRITATRHALKTL